MRFFTLGKCKNYENRICKKYKIRGSCVEPKNPIPQLLTLSKKKRNLADCVFFKWWSRWGSNSRPLECDSSALPTELRPRIFSAGLLSRALSNFQKSCSERDSNPHGFRHTPLKRTCLPIPPPERFLKPHTCTDLYFHCKTFFYFFEFFFFSPGLFFMNRLSFASDNPCVYCWYGF